MAMLIERLDHHQAGDSSRSRKARHRQRRTGGGRRQVSRRRPRAVNTPDKLLTAAGDKPMPMEYEPTRCQWGGAKKKGRQPHAKGKTAPDAELNQNARANLAVRPR